MVEVSMHFVPGYSHWVPSSFVSPVHEKTRRRVDYGGQAGTNLCEQNLPFGSKLTLMGRTPRNGNKLRSSAESARENVDDVAFSSRIDTRFQRQGPVG
jgi:hypothetical protein